MNIAVWIVSAILAAAYLFTGTNKATRPKDKPKPRSAAPRTW
jgi:hypothetical protein